MSDVQSPTPLQTKYTPYIIPHIILSCVVGLAIIWCFPKFYQHRTHPVLKYRTFYIYILALVCGYIFLIIDMVRSIPNLLSVPLYRYSLIIELSLDSLFYGCVASVGIRFWALVLTRYVQGQLMDRRTCTDGRFYRRVVAQILWCRWLTFVRTAVIVLIAFFVPIFMYLVIPYFFASDEIIESIMQGKPTQTNLISRSIVLAGTALTLCKQKQPNI